MRKIKEIIKVVREKRCGVGYAREEGVHVDHS